MQMAEFGKSMLNYLHLQADWCIYIDINIYVFVIGCDLNVSYRLGEDDWLWNVEQYLRERYMVRGLNLDVSKPVCVAATVDAA